MQQDTENLIMLAVGPLAAILLGMALVPVRSYTSASNLTFIFLILTILIAEYGGRWAAFATALSSALSLDFFLTMPYLRLTIKGIHDIIAFAGLTVCGLLVAAFSSQRGAKATELSSAREQLDVLHTAISNLTSATQLESQLGNLLDAARGCAPLAAAAVRNESNAVLAAFAPRKAIMPVPVLVLSPRTLFPKDAGPDSPQNLPFPNEGARVPLVIRNRQFGWLDLWGNGVPATAEMRRTLSDVALLVTLLLGMHKQDVGLSSQP